MPMPKLYPVKFVIYVTAAMGRRIDLMKALRAARLGNIDTRASLCREALALGLAGMERSEHAAVAGSAQFDRGPEPGGAG